MRNFLTILCTLLSIYATAKSNKFGRGKINSSSTIIFLPMGDVTRQFDGTEFNLITDSTNLVRDSVGNLLEYNTVQQYFTGAWLNTHKVVFTYNASNECIEEIIKNFNFITFQLQNTTRTTRTIDATHRLIDVTNYTWQNSTSSWRNQNKFFYSYSGNNMSLELQQTWDTIANVWKNESKKNYSYNQFNQIKNITVQSYLNNNWVDATRTDSLVWPNNTELESPIQYIEFEWNASLNAWMKKIKYTRINTGFSKPFKIEEFSWNGQNWIALRETNYFYDVNKNEIQRTSNNWSIALNQFLPSEDVISTWDADNKLIADSTFLFDNNGGLTGGKRNTYAYDANNNLLYDTIATYHLGNNEFMVDSRKKFYYKNYPFNKLNELKVNKSALNIRPNIVSDITTFSLTDQSIGTLKIINSNGIILQEHKTFTGSISLDLTTLAAGLYIAQVSSLSGKLIQAKFIKL